MAVWAAVSERRFRERAELDFTDPPKFPFQPVPLFEPSENTSPAEAAKVAAFAKSPMCVEMLLDQMGTSGKNVHFHVEHFAALRKKYTVDREPSKRNDDTVRFSDDLVSCCG